MKLSIAPCWNQRLKAEFEKPYFLDLVQFVRQEYAQHTCYPGANRIFAAFDHCPFMETKVVILGQDPYHGPGQANGLCFSVQDGVAHPPSLINIFKEIATDVKTPYPTSGNLERWAQQGVLLLNATLTVRAGAPGSHQGKGWEMFTDAVITRLSEERKGIVFLLWGGLAKRKSQLIDRKKHHLLTSGHPSPLSANRGYWFGNAHFSKCNIILTDIGEKPVVW